MARVMANAMPVISRTKPATLINNHLEEVNMANGDNEQSEIEKLEEYAGWIEEGDLGALWLEKAGELVKKHPQYRERLDEAVSKGETKKIERFMRWIGEGDLSWVERASKLVAKHPEYKTRLDEVASAGRGISGKETVTDVKNGYLDDGSLIPIPAELSRLPAEYAGKIRSQIEQFNGLREQMAETNDWKSSGKPAYNALLEIFSYSKSRNGENPEKEMAFLDDVPELQAPLAIGLDRLTMGLMSVRAEGSICEKRYNHWLDKIGSLKNKVLDYRPRESAWGNKTQS